MARILNLSELVKLATANDTDTDPGYGKRIPFNRNERIGDDGTVGNSIDSGRWHSLWKYGGDPVRGDTPTTTPASPTRTSPGAIVIPSLLGDSFWLVGGAVTSAGRSEVVLYDRLVHTGGHSGTVTTSQSLTGFNVARYTSSDDLELFVEIYSQIGATPQTLSIPINDGASGTPTLTVSIGGTGRREQGRLLPVGLKRQAPGLSSVTSMQLGGSTGTAGSYGLTLARPLMRWQASSSGIACIKSTTRGFDEMVEIKSNACLALAVFAGESMVVTVHGYIHVVEKL